MHPYLHMPAVYAATWPFPPTLVPAALPGWVPRGCFPAAHQFFTLVLLSHMLAHKPSSQFPPSQQGLAGKRGVESLRRLSHLRCCLLLEVEGKAQGARRRGFPPDGKSWILQEGWSSAFRSFLALLPRKSCQWGELAAPPPLPGSSAWEDLLSSQPDSFWMAAELHMGLAIALSLCSASPFHLWITGVVHFSQRTERSFQELQNHSKLMGAGSPKGPWRATLPQCSSSPDVHWNWDSYGTGCF